MKRPLALFCYFMLLLLQAALWACNKNASGKRTSDKNSDIIRAGDMKARGSYDSAILFYRKDIQRNLDAKQYDAWLNSTSAIVECFRLKGNPDEAMRIVEQAQALAYTRMDTSSNAYNLLIHKKALLYADKRQFEFASALYLRNIRLYLANPNSADSVLALAFNGVGTIYLMQNKYPEALAQYQNAVDTYIKGNLIKSTNYSGSLQNIGIVYSMTGNYEKAEQYFLQSLKVNQEILQPHDQKLAALFLNMGRFYQIIRNDSKAIEYMKRAEESYIQNNQSNSVTAGSLFLNMGVIYIYSADYQKAQSYLNKSLEIILAKAPANLADLLLIYLNMGHIAEKKGDFTEARQYYLKGLEVGGKLPNSVKILRGLANVSYKMKDKVNADNYYNKALQKSIEIYGEEHTETALTYLRYGDFLSDNGDARAIKYLEKALAISLKSFGPVSLDVSTAYFYIGNYYYRVKEYDKALNYCQLSLIAGFPGFTSRFQSDNPDITKADLNGNLVDPLIAKAMALYSLYTSDTSRVDLLKSSAATYDLSLKMIERLRSAYQGEDSKLIISGDKKNTYSNALFAQVKLYQKTKSQDALEQAFSFSEKGKSAVLLSHLRDKDARNTGRIPQDLLNRDASLKSEIYFYNKQIHDQKIAVNPDEAKIKMWNSRIFDLSQKQEELIRSIEKDYPLYYNMKYDNSVTSIETIQKKLSPTQAIVEYSLTDSSLFAFAITNNKKQLFTTSIGPDFFDNLQTVREQLTGKQFNDYSRSDFRIFALASNQLYKTLIQPLEPIIKGKDLILVPDGELGYLSFDILLTSMPDTIKVSYRKLPYLIKESAVTYTPSATAFFDELKMNANKNNGKVIAFGPNYSSDNHTLDLKDEKGRPLRDVLTDLTNTQKEIESLEKYFNVKKFLNSAATEEAFKKFAPDYKVLHLAMHTLINNDNSLYSKLVFFKPGGDTIEDGLLNASELVNMELHADMAVLSACNTGTGKLQKGEGIMSLSRDFFYAGVPGIVMTSWAIEDRTGIKLMEYFYKYISEGKPRNEALRLAKVEYLENCDNLTSHPHYWAAYMNVGDISPIEGFGKRTNPFSLYSAAASLIAITLLLLLRYRKNQANRNAAN